MKTKFIKLIIFFIGYLAQSQITTIPDANFEQVLIDLGIDSDGIINGQVLTSDVQNLSELIFDHENTTATEIDLSGIESFTSLEKLSINFLIIKNIDLSQNTQLKILNIQHTGIGEFGGITSLNVSSNILLEELYAGNPGLDVGPFNMIEELDFSNNPNIRIVNLYNMSSIKYINLKNDSNNSDMSITISLYPWWMDDPTDNGAIKNTICIEVDDAVLAQNGGTPYSNWNINTGQRVVYYYINNYSECTASTPSFHLLGVKIYPNPAKDMVYFDIEDSIHIYKTNLVDMSGRIVRTDKEGKRNFSIQGLIKGTYILQLSTNKGIYSSNLLVE